MPEMGTIEDSAPERGFFEIGSDKGTRVRTFDRMPGLCYTLFGSRCRVRCILSLVLSDKPFPYIAKGAVLLLPPPGRKRLACLQEK
jgi:hypothetical protein